MTFKHQILHRLSPGYSRELATGMVAQWLQDGMIHLTFYRDAGSITSENFTAETGPSPAQKAVTMTPDSPPVTTENFREDVATIMVPLSLLAQMSTVLNAVPGVVAQQQAQIASTPDKSQ